MSLLELRGICKRFAGTVALNNVNLTLQTGKILALVGENGAGKSTLMKILSGVHQPDAGSMTLDGKPLRLRNPLDARLHGISIIYQEFSLVPDLNVIDNLFLGRERTNVFGASRRGAMRQEAESTLKGLGVEFPVTSIVSRLGIAQQQFVEIAKALLDSPRVLIMDEPTATLTVQESQRLLDIMRQLAKQGISIIFISHHLDEVFEIADDIVCLRDGECVGSGKHGELSRDELIGMMVGRVLCSSFPHEDRTPSNAVLLDVRCIQRKPHLPQNSFQLRQGEILGVAGLVGSGRTKMIRAIMGADRAYRHDVVLRGVPLQVQSPADARRAGIGLVPEDRKKQGLVLGASVRANLLLAGLQKLCHPVWHFVQRSKVAATSNTQIQRLRIKATSQHQATQTLSGGNQQKVVLGKWLLAECSVLILDEPTRGIDVGAKAEIYQLLRELRDHGVSILLISSEIPEVIGMCDRVMVMRNQQIVHVFDSQERVTEAGIMNHAAGGVCV